MSDHSGNCIFCKIAKKEVSAFIVYEDELCVAFLDLRQVREGHTIVIPKRHIDHFMDLDDALSSHILSIAQRIARKIKDTLHPYRVGYVVAGFGIPHAHLHVQPMWEEHDITSQRYLDLTQTPPIFNIQVLPILSEEDRQKTLNKIKL